MLVLVVTLRFDNMQEFSYLDCKFAIFPVLTDLCGFGTYHTFTSKEKEDSCVVFVQFRSLPLEIISDHPALYIKV